jgi:hypothetical protein
MSRSVPDNEQGLLQRAVASVMTGTAIVGPLVANGLFATFISPQAPIELPAPRSSSAACCVWWRFSSRRGDPRSLGCTHLSGRWRYHNPPRLLDGR